MKKEIIEAEGAPAAVGPYNQIIKGCGLYFFSGQIPLDPESGELVAGGIEEQTMRVLENIDLLLRSIGKERESVLKCVIYLTDLNQFGKVNEIYGRYFASNFPARSTVEVAALPKGALIEIEVTVAE